MKLNKAYFKHLIKTNWIQTLIFVGIATLISSVVAVTFEYEYNYYYIGNTLVGKPLYREPTSITSSLICTYISSFLLVIFRFAFLKKKNTTIQYASLPINRKTILLNSYIFVLAQVLIIYFISFFTSFLCFLFKAGEHYRVGFILLLFLTSIFVLIISTLFFIFIFLRANNIADGVIFLIMSIVIPSFLYISNLLYVMFDSDLISASFIPFYSLISVNNIFLELSTGPVTFGPGNYFNMELIVSLIINISLYTLIAIFGTWFSLHTIKNDKVENVGYVSTSIFGYPIMLPLFLFSISTMYFEISYVILVFMTIYLAIGWALFILFRRGIKLKWWDYVSIVGSVVLAILVIFFVELSKYL